MSGHSKWSTIKRKKGKEDEKRGRIFSRLAKEITVAARSGGGDVEANPRLRLAVQAARSANMPADNITRAIKRGTGEIEGAQFEEAAYEVYGPGGVAIVVEVMTDNKNRTTPEIRHLLERHGGNMASLGSVSWMFDRKGTVHVDDEKASEDAVVEAVLDAGADDVKAGEEGGFDVYCPPEKLAAVTEALQGANIRYATAEVSLLPKSTVKLDKTHAAKFLKLMDALEDHDDVQKVFANDEIPPEVMEELAAE